MLGRFADLPRYPAPAAPRAFPTADMDADASSGSNTPIYGRLTSTPMREGVMVRVVLVDINPKMVQAWRSSFEGNPEVEIVQGSMLDQTVSAWVSPTNSQGNMDGGLDAIVKKNLG